MAIVFGRRWVEQLEGTGGADLILALAGPVTIIGGGGNDIILGSRAGDLIHGDGPAGPMPWETPRPGNNLIFARGGNDTVYAGFGADTVWGGDGDDMIYGAGQGQPGPGERAYRLDGPDLLLGGAGNDVISGGGGGDTIHAGGGDDVLRGDLGADVLHGGCGADIFVFGRGGPIDAFAPHSETRETGAPDVILDFEQGVDRLDVRGLGHSHMPWLPMLFRGEAEFLTDLHPQLRYERLEDGTTVVQVFSLVGRPAPGVVPPPDVAAEIILVGHVDLTEADFILA
ncbi:MAG TPA: M10 family metallopeptidase C-terminal domain-containing protein [Falsiroseomonas sp.]|jgi:Ca2+-binding RTX toxin-like protein|nr:M10 family metallopeptidase C-terminal domain-containing protein [Falsiroseomonas sp.]